MHDDVIHRVANLLLEAKGLLTDEHSRMLRVTLDMALIEVGRTIAAQVEKVTEDA